jgi:hypothetical protein
MRALIASACLVVSVQAVCLGENWPQWRGPSMNGVASDRKVPVSWSATENVTWKLALPDFSGSTPIIWNDRIFLNGPTAPSVPRVRGPRQGTELWKAHLGTGNAKVRKQNMSSPSPATDARVWVMTGTGVLKAFDFGGKEIWARDLQKEYGPFGLNWGYASSPLLHKDHLYVEVLHGMKTDDPSYVLSIDKLTGKTWAVGGRAQPSAVAGRLHDAARGVFRAAPRSWSGGDVVTGHDPATGKELAAQGAEPDGPLPHVAFPWR